MEFIRTCTAIVGRFFISIVFLAGAIKNLFTWRESEATLMGVLSDWQGNVQFSESLQEFLSFLTPWANVLLALATLFCLVGGLLILLGIREKFGACLLLLFLIPATLLYHCFWFMDGGLREFATVDFLKNLAIIGSLLLMLLHGAQPR